MKGEESQLNINVGKTENLRTRKILPTGQVHRRERIIKIEVRSGKQISAFLLPTFSALILP